MDYEYIDESDIVAVKRGRKSEVPQELVDAIAGIPAGKVIALKGLALDPKSEDYGKDKQTVASRIRQAGRLAGHEVAIAWSPAGVPQVKHKVGAKKKK